MILFTEHDKGCTALPYNSLDVCQRLVDRAVGVETNCLGVFQGCFLQSSRHRGLRRMFFGGRQVYGGQRCVAHNAGAAGRVHRWFVSADNLVHCRRYGSEFVGDLTTSLRISLTSRLDSLSVERQTTVFVRPEAKNVLCGDYNKSTVFIVHRINSTVSVVCCSQTRSHPWLKKRFSPYDCM